MSSQSSLQLSGSSWHIPSESGSVPSAYSTRPNPEHVGFASIGYDYPRSSDYPHGWEFSMPVHGYDARPRVLEHPFDLPLTQSQFVDGPSGNLDQLFPRIRTYEVIYTDDARMKPGSGMRRQCFNCKSIETATWRRSMLSPGKLVRLTSFFETICLKFLQLCNKCGLFERTHAVPRPKTFPRRRRSRPAPVHSGMNILPFDGHGSDPHRHYQNDHPSIMPLTAHTFNTFGSVCGEAISQDTSWVTHSPPDVSSTPTRVIACYPAAQQSTVYCTDSHLPSAAPVETVCTTSSWELSPCS
jgi:hypothetical protein